MTTEQEPKGDKQRPRSLANLAEDMDRLFDRAVRDMRGWPFPRPWRYRPWGSREWFPDVDMFERENEIVVRVDLPGIKPEDVDVAVEGDSLVIRGHRHEEKETSEKHYYYSERSSGEFVRSIPLPEGVNTDDIKASYEHGLLDIVMPRPAAAKPPAKKVDIEVK